MRPGKSGTLQKQFWSVLLIALLFFSYSGNITAQPGNNQYHILFIGNSYTYINSLPQMFKSLVENQFPDYHITVKFIGGGGATLKNHWEVGEAVKEIKTGYWNYVILQGQSMLGSDDLTEPDSPDQFYKYSQRLDAEIKKSGAKTVFFMTWSRKNLPEQQKYLTKAYSTISTELGSTLAPVGLVWKKFREISTINLYRRDRSHPTITGTYLSALTLFNSIFHTIPATLPGTLYGHKILHGGNIPAYKSRLCDLSKESIKLLRQAVVDVMNNQKKVASPGS